MLHFKKSEYTVTRTSTSRKMRRYAENVEYDDDGSDIHLPNKPDNK